MASFGSSRRAVMLAALLLAPVRAAAEESRWVKFSEMLQHLVSDPAFVETVIQRLGRGPASSAMLAPADQDRLRALIKKRDWNSLDRFPIMTVARMGTAVKLSAPVAKRRKRAAPRPAPVPAEESADLGIPSDEAPPRLKDVLQTLGRGVDYGAVLDPEAVKRYPDSKRLADLLNRLALNPPPGQAGPRFEVRLAGLQARTADRLVAILQSRGHDVVVRDSRYFANFGNLRYRNRDVTTPFWIDTRLPLPNRKENLVIPATHSQHELSIRGPQVNADVAFYFGVDGAAAFRAFATKDQSWILGRTAWTYRGPQALAAVRIAALIRRTYAELKAAHPGLAYGGYYELGVCNDANAMIEYALQGRATLYPLTRDPALFPQDGEVGRLARALPTDRTGVPDLDRVLGSLPSDDLGRLPFPGLRADLAALQAAPRPGPWQAARRSGARWVFLAALAAALWALLRRGRFKRLIEAQGLQRLAKSLGLGFWERFLLLRHDLSTRDKLRRVFRRGQDPYQYATSPYERLRLERMEALLAGRRYSRGLEVGCAEGRFTQRLAGLCGRIWALDLSPDALDRARRAVPGPQVEWVQANARTWEPPGSFDLIVLAEVLYYLPAPGKGPAFEEAFEQFLRRLVSWLEPGGHILLAHGFGNEAERADREDYARRLERLGLRRLRCEQTGEQAHDKGTLRCVLHLLEKAPA